ncbi:SgcJ/EcaC family oxidoreductase [Nocardia farcinica]|uniref:SgcJ/EcaC family oxidoreductase n=1 Tax=Nocardia farcinica TaxID=37329 RepID=UPI001895ABCD|nr:SgcJ/EcaC family oxidoreductase [Nocardia farcinica]MBF6266982.1 SgcJ/EcaC family oxidoreductase [Nocardia farcinica]
MTDPDAVVRALCQAWSTPDPDAIAAYFAEDAVYHNIPMEPVIGRTAIREFVAGFLTTFEAIDFEIHHQVAADGVVMNERTDTMRGKDGRATPLPVMGVFEVRDGLITAWRDYFDMAAVTAAFAPPE